MALIQEVLRRPEFDHEPPVLVDVGASGGPASDWAALAPRAVCLAFEPDARELGWVERRGSGYRRLVVYRGVASPVETDTAEFFLTRFPYCSSTLRPMGERLTPWAFHARFDVTEVVRRPAITLPRALREQGLDRVDWFKCDSQGTDLRLFQSLGEGRMRRVLAAQFEPGIMIAYQGEDTLADLLAFMRERGFWLSDLHLFGAQRLSDRARGQLPGPLRAHARWLLKTSPGWGEATYLNTLEGEWGVRDLLLGWVIGTLRHQHGFALELALRGRETSGDPCFERMRTASARAIARAALTAPARVLVRLLRSFAVRRSWI